MEHTHIQSTDSCVGGLLQWDVLTTLELVAVLDVLPEPLVSNRLPLASHVTGLCCGLLQDQAAAVVADASHHIQPAGRPCHYHLLLQSRDQTGGTDRQPST